MSNYETLVDMSSGKGVACLCFPNKARLTIGEITDIFSEYGDIVGINCAGNEIGYRFVRFRKKEQALKCAIALDGHPAITLQPVKMRGKDPKETLQSNQVKNNNQIDMKRQNNDQSPCNALDTSKAESIKGSQSSRKSGSNNNKKYNKANIVENDGADNNINNVYDETNKEIQNAEQPEANDRNSKTKNNMNPRQRNNFSRTNRLHFNQSATTNPENRLNAAKLAELHKLRGTVTNTFQPSGDSASVPTTAAVPSSKISSVGSWNHSINGQSATNDMPPPLISGASALRSVLGNVTKKEIQVLLACDVIIANIHSNIGVSNIYHMLGKFGPLYVSDIETVPEINIRFCYVYFETPDDALKAEQTFDGAPLCGQSLITMRSQRLEAEAGIF